MKSVREKCPDTVTILLTGYPDGLKGDALTIETRIVGVADIFDALYSDRPYREKLPLSAVKDILMQDVNSGCLDAEVVGVLFEMIDHGDIELEYLRLQK